MIFCRWLDGPPLEEIVRRDLRVGDRREPRNGRDPRAPDRREADRRDERPAPPGGGSSSIAAGASEPAPETHVLEGSPSASPAPTPELALPSGAEASPTRPIAKPD